MKQIIPIKKDIIFKTKIGEITNINLDKNYKVKDDLIDGYIDVYGTYKMTEASVLEEEFSYKVPFGVSVVKNIKKDTVKIEIDDFNYKFNRDVLSINIDLNFECEEYREEKENEIVNNDIENTIKDNNTKFELENEIDSQIELDNNIEVDDNNVGINNNNVEVNNQDENINIEENINNITNIINNEEKYYTYKVYIVREGDTLDTICNKYNVTLNDLSEYNETNNIKVGDKIIIPYINE